MVTKSNKQLLYAIGILLVLVVGFTIFKEGKEFAITSPTFFAKPLWARLECAPTDAIEGIQTTFTSLSGKFKQIKCGIEENTDKCDLYATVGSTFFNGRFNYCKDDNLDNKCDNEEVEIKAGSQSTQYFIKSMKEGDNLIFWCENAFGLNVECSSIRKEYRPWKLFRFVGGAKFEAKANTCKLSDVSGILGKIPTLQRTPIDELTFTGGDGFQWINFVHDWAYGPATNVFKYQGRDVYCTGNAIYEIQNMQMKDGQLVKINPEYNPPNDLPFQIQTIGTKIKNVQCCSNEPNCDSNFNIIPDKPIQKCFTDAQCQNAGNPIPTGPKTLVKQSCQNSVCVWGQVYQVECTQDLVCQNPLVCDKLSYKCIKPDVGGYCGDNQCNRDETRISCPKDCGEQQIKTCTSCFGWLWNKVTGNKYCTPQPAKKVLGFIPVPLTSQNKVCPIFLLILLIVLGGGGFWLYSVYKKKGGKKKKK